MNRRQFLALSALAGGATAVAGCTASPGGSFVAASAPSGAGVLDIARANQLNSFVRAVETAGLTEQLSGEGPYTLFVPSDAAFRAAGVSPTGDAASLRRMLGYHVVPGQVGSSFMTGMSMGHTTSTGDAVRVDGRGSGIRVNDANLVRRDLLAGNGVVHVVDRILTPA